MQTLTLALAGHQYPIHIGSGLLGDHEFLRRTIEHRQVFVLTDENVAPHWLSALRLAFVDRDYAELILPPGEQQKSIASFTHVLDTLVSTKHRRNSVLIALGGGVVGDLGGFVASCYQRGIDLVQVPTTLLAQVDSSVGGKTAINHAAGKNLIGAFHQPQSVIIDIDTLKTLPSREFISGFAEVVKYGVIHDPDFLLWLEQNVEQLGKADPELLTQAVARSCAIKAEIVVQDPKENGRRAILNFGHTFAHAIESELGYGAWLHGEAVSVGMVMAAELAMHSGLLVDESLPQRLRVLLKRFLLPTTLPSSVNRTNLLAHMTMDKKNTSNSVRFVLPECLGMVHLVDQLSPEHILKAMQS